MERGELFSGLALLTSIAAFIMVLTMSGSEKELSASAQAELSKQLEQLIDDKVSDTADTLRTELIDKLYSTLMNYESAEDSVLAGHDLKELVQQAKSDPDTARLLRAAIESVILKEMATELASVDWLDTLSKEKLQALLTKTAQASMTSGMRSFQTPVDVSDIEGVDGKIDRILQEFEGVNFYSHNNALVKQIAEMGDEAIEPLLEKLQDGSTGHNFAMNMAITDSLEKLLSEEHEELIIAEFSKDGKFSNLIEKYQFPAAEAAVMDHIKYPNHGHVDNNVVDAALKMNTEQAIPLLIDYVSHGQNVSYAASQLAVEGVDVTEPLRQASNRARNTWEKAALVELCLERDMPEGYDLATQVLRSNEPHAEHSQEKVYQYIRKYTGLNGSYEEVADWLQENKPY